MAGRFAKKTGSMAPTAEGLLQAVLFGAAHYKLGSLSILNAGMIGVVMGAMYYIGKRNLWHCIFAHGLIDSFGLTMLFLGVGHH